MGGKSGATVGFWYKLLYHMGLGLGPIDAFLEFRAANKTAWSGEMTASGTININQSNLFGGEKNMGGIVSGVDVMFGDADAAPNAYLTQNLGDQVATWRGIATLVFKGGKYGAMNPYPQKPSYKFRKIKAGWDGGCWYPDKAEIPVVGSQSLPIDADGWEYQIVPKAPDPGHTDLTPPTDGWLPAPPGPWSDSNIWPEQTTLWLRRTVTISGANQTCHLAADNGCVLLVNGAVVGASNADNKPIPSNEQYPVDFPLAAGNTFQLAGKAYCEKEASDDAGTYCSVSITAAGLTAMNPAHILYYARTQSHMGREAPSAMNDASFAVAADRYASQGFGLCTAYDPSQESVDAFCERICKAAGCALNRSPVDGQWYLDIANGVYDLDTLPILTDDDILDFEEQPTNLDNAVNSVSVQYFDTQNKESRTTPPAEAIALVNQFGTIHQDTSYPEIPTSELAVWAATRDLRRTVTPTHGFQLTTARKTHSWRRNTYFRLQSTKRGIADMVCIVGDTQTGTLKSGAIQLTAVEDIYSIPTTTFVDTETGVDTRPPVTPVAIMQQAVFEAPYIEIVSRLSRADLAALPDDAGYLETVARAPGNYRGYAIDVSTDGGSTYAAAGDGPWCPVAQIIEGDALTDAAPATNFTLANGALLADVVIGQAALWDNEICRVDAIDPQANPPTFTLGRGCADTVPAAHAASSVIWFFGGFAGADTTEYTDAESIYIKLLTESGSRQLDPDLAASLALTFDQRQFRPYAPGKLQINGSWYPTVITGALSLAWAHRDRVSQSDQLLDTTQPSTQPETGQTATLRIYAENDSLLRSVDGITDAQYLYSTSDEITDAGGVLGDPYAANVTSLLHFDGSLTDACGPQWQIAGSGLTIAPTGGQFGGCSTNTSHATYIATSDPALNLASASKWTVDMSVRTTVTPSDISGLFFSGNPSSNSNRFMLQFRGDGHMSWFSAGSPQINNGAVGPVLSDGVWHYIRAAYDGARVYLFVDGGLVANYAGGMPTTGFSQFLIGTIRNSNNLDHGFVGDIDEFRVTLGVCRSTSDYQPQAPYALSAPSGRLNGRLRFELEASRGDVASFQHHDVVVRRAGYGMNYGMFYGGHT